MLLPRCWPFAAAQHWREDLAEAAAPPAFLRAFVTGVAYTLVQLAQDWERRMAA